MTRCAEGTTVAAEKSEAEIKILLRKRGATQIWSGSDYGKGDEPGERSSWASRRTGSRSSRARGAGARSYVHDRARARHLSGPSEGLAWRDWP